MTLGQGLIDFTNLRGHKYAKIVAIILALSPLY